MPAESFLFFSCPTDEPDLWIWSVLFGKGTKRIGEMKLFFFGWVFFFLFFFLKKALSFSLGGSSTTSTCARGHSARQVVWFIVLYIPLSIICPSTVFCFPDRWVNARVDLLSTFYQHFLQALSSARQRCCPRHLRVFFCVGERR